MEDSLYLNLEILSLSISLALGHSFCEGNEHLTSLHAKIHLWKMALLFKRNIPINFCRGLNATTFSASVCYSFH